MQHKHDDNIKFLTLLVNGPRILGNMLGNGMHMLSNGPHVLGNGPQMLGNGLHVLGNGPHACILNS